MHALLLPLSFCPCTKYTFYSSFFTPLVSLLLSGAVLHNIIVIEPGKRGEGKRKKRWIDRKTPFLSHSCNTFTNGIILLPSRHAELGQEERHFELHTESVSSMQQLTHSFLLFFSIQFLPSLHKSSETSPLFCLLLFLLVS